MRILDRYMIRRFSLTLIYAMLAFTLIVIFVDMVGHLAKFIDKEVPKVIIAKYYIFYIPQILVLALPIAMLLASLFSLGYMSRHNELTATKSAGISIYRTLTPIFILSLFVSLFALGFGESILPAANQDKRNIEKTFLDPFRSSTRRLESNIFLRDKNERRIFLGQYNLKNYTAQKVTIQKYDANQIIERLDAPRMEWKDSTWVLLNGYKRIFVDRKEIATAFDTLQVDLEIDPEKITRLRVEPEDMSFSELKHFISEIRRNGGNPNRWLVDLHFKVSLPFANLIMVLFGAPLASTKNQSGAIFGFIMSLFICFVYYGSNKFIQTLGQSGNLVPLAAAWLTNGVFLIAGLLLLLLIRK